MISRLHMPVDLWDTAYLQMNAGIEDISQVVDFFELPLDLQSGRLDNEPIHDTIDQASRKEEAPSTWIAIVSLKAPTMMRHIRSQKN